MTKETVTSLPDQLLTKSWTCYAWLAGFARAYDGGRKGVWFLILFIFGNLGFLAFMLTLVPGLRVPSTRPRLLIFLILIWH